MKCNNTKLQPYPKLEVESCIKLSIFELNRQKLLEHKSSGALQCTLRDELIFSIQIFALVKDSLGLISLVYLSTDGTTIESLILLTKTKCNFGGSRWWLTCPLKINDKYCGKRVGVLYKPFNANYFACRFCLNLTYQSSKISGYQKRFGKRWSFPELIELESRIKKKYYRGNITKRYNSFLNKVVQTDIGFKAFMDKVMGK